MHDNWTQCDSFEVVIVVVVVMRGRRECDKQTTRPRGGFSCVLLCPRKFSFPFLTPFSRGTRENNHNQPPSVTSVVYSNVHRKGERGGRRRIGILIYFETNRATFDGFFSCALLVYHNKQQINFKSLSIANSVFNFSWHDNKNNGNTVGGGWVGGWF